MNSVILPRFMALIAMVVFLIVGRVAPGFASEINPFVGEYEGSADMVSSDGTSVPRDMSVSISETKDGFNVAWVTTTYKADGRTKENAYSVDFLPTDRDGIYSAAMKRNVFGHAVQLDPMKGEPFVWGRIYEDTLTVYSLFVNDRGGYELQQFDRTLVDDGLMLEFSRIRDGAPARSVKTQLSKK